MAGNKRQVQEINAGSMADIAFLLLIFFLVATSMSTDYGIQRVLPPFQDNETIKQEEKERNLFLVLVNAADRILAGTPGNQQEIDLSLLKDKARNFVLNPTNDANMPELVMTDVELIGNYPVSKGIVSLQNDRGASYEMYIKVQNELTKVFNEIRDEVSQRYFGKNFNELGKREQEAIRTAVPQKISEAEPRGITTN